jgi:nucleoside 2-deoxyribosyltransferase
MGAEVYLHEEHSEPGMNLADKLTQAIGSCDAVIVLITANAAPSSYVNQEIGVAIGKQIPIIPLVEVGIPHERLAMLQGLEYIPFRHEHLHEAITAITERFQAMQETKHRNELARQQLRIQNQQQQIQRQQTEMVAMTVVIVALVALVIYMETKG